MTNAGSDNVSAFSIGSGGGLTAVSGSPFAADSNPIGVAVSPDGAHLYVTNAGSDNVSAFSIGSGGGLTAVSGSPFAADGKPYGVAVSPDGAHLYVTNLQSGNVSAFSIGSGGGSTAVSGSPFAAGTFPVGVVVSPDSDLALRNVPGDMTVNATGPGGAVVTYTLPTVVDEDAVKPTVGCLPGSGSLFAVGKTTVTCKVTDADDSNSPVTATFNVTVTDSDLALHNVPGNITTDATGPGGAVVHYTPPNATDEGGQTPAVSCDHPSGSMFPIGTTTVKCSASASDGDDSNSPVTAQFSVTVNGALAQLQDPLLPDVKAIPASLGRLILANDVNGMINNLQHGNTVQVCGDLSFMGLVVQEWSGALMTTAQADTILAEVDQISAVLGCNATPT